MLRTSCVCGDERQIDLSLRHAGQVDLCFFSRFFQALKRHFIRLQVNQFASSELLCHPVDDALVKVVAAQMIVACGCENLLYAVPHFDD